MEVKTQEIDEEKIEQAVRYALSTSFCLDELSRLLVMEGGVDLDTLARIIRENRGESPSDMQTPEQPEFIGRALQEDQSSRSWFGLKLAI